MSGVLAGAALCTILLGLNHDNPRYLVACVIATGFCIIGGQLTLNAFASNFYPAHVRATGTGWALGVGRFGSILGPLFGSLLLAMHIPVQQIFFFCAIPAVIAALLIIQVRSPLEAVSEPLNLGEVTQPFGQAQPLDRIVAEQQRVFEIEAFGVRAVEALVQAGAGEVVGGVCVTEFEHAFGVDQRGDEVVVGQVQLAQVA